MYLINFQKFANSVFNFTDVEIVNHVGKWNGKIYKYYGLLLNPSSFDNTPRSMTFFRVNSISKLCRAISFFPHKIEPRTQFQCKFKLFLCKDIKQFKYTKYRILSDSEYAAESKFIREYLISVHWWGFFGIYEERTAHHQNEIYSCYLYAVSVSK